MVARIQSVYGLVASVVIACICSGCQMSENKWMTALKERQKPKQNFKGFEPEEEITYWPKKPKSQNKTKMTEMPSELKEKLASRTRQKNRDVELTEHLTEGDRYRKSGKLEDARIEYEKALKLSPKNADVHHRLAVIADKQHQYSLADEHYDAALKLRPRDANLLSDLGYSHFLRGNLKKSEETLRQALEIEPSHKLAMGTLGTIFAQQNRQADALAMFRNGATSEAEAQLYMASLFQQGGQGNRNVSSALNGGNHPDPIVAASNSNPQEDLSKLDMDQVRQLMAREKQAAQQRRYESEQQEIERLRRLASDEDIFQHSQYPGGSKNSNRPQQGYAANGSIEIGPRGNGGSNSSNGYSGNNNGYGNEPPRGQAGHADQSFAANGSSQNQQGFGGRPDNRLAQGYGDFRGHGSQADWGRMAEPDVQHAVDQRPPVAGSNGYQQATGQQPLGSSNASQMATQLGLNAGPGSMFPVIPGNDGAAGGQMNSSGSFDNRFGGEFQQAPVQQPQQNWNGNQPMVAASATGQIESLPVIAPASPTSNWGSPSGGSLNWQNPASATSGWDQSIPAASGAAGSGFDSGASLLRENQNLDPRQSIDRSPPPAGPNNRARTGNEMSRPYNGAWPNTNSIPSNSSLNQNNNIRIDQNSNGFGNAPTINANGNRTPQSASSQGGSLPQYPYGPNR